MTRIITFWQALRSPVRWGIYTALVADVGLATASLNGSATWAQTGVSVATSTLLLVVGWFAP